MNGDTSTAIRVDALGWSWRDLGILKKTAGLLLPPFVVIAGVLWSAELVPPPTYPWLSLGLLTLIGIATILTIDLPGLLRGEATRVWLFLQPLFVQVAIALSRFGWPWGLSIFALQGWIVVCLN